MPKIYFTLKVYIEILESSKISLVSQATGGLYLANHNYISVRLSKIPRALVQLKLPLVEIKENKSIA